MTALRWGVALLGWPAQGHLAVAAGEAGRTAGGEPVPSRGGPGPAPRWPPRRRGGRPGAAPPWARGDHIVDPVWGRSTVPTIATSTGRRAITQRSQPLLTRVVVSYSTRTGTAARSAIPHDALSRLSAAGTEVTIAVASRSAEADLNAGGQEQVSLSHFLSFAAQGYPDTVVRVCAIDRRIGGIPPRRHWRLAHVRFGVTASEHDVVPQRRAGARPGRMSPPARRRSRSS